MLVDDDTAPVAVTPTELKLDVDDGARDNDEVLAGTFVAICDTIGVVATGTVPTVLVVVAPTTAGVTERDNGGVVTVVVSDVGRLNENCPCDGPAVNAPGATKSSPPNTP